MASNVGGRIQNAGADENTEALKKEICLSKRVQEHERHRQKVA